MNGVAWDVNGLGCHLASATISGKNDDAPKRFLLFPLLLAFWTYSCFSDSYRNIPSPPPSPLSLFPQGTFQPVGQVFVHRHQPCWARAAVGAGCPQSQPPEDTQPAPGSQGLRIWKSLSGSSCLLSPTALSHPKGGSHCEVIPESL